MKYNYIIYSVNSDYKKNHLFKNLQDLDNVSLCYHAISTNNKILNALFRLHWSEKINNIVNLPFKWIWFKMMYGENFNNQKPNCYIFFEGKYADNSTTFTKYLKSRDVRNMSICYYLDLINKRKPYRYNSIKSNVDIVISYDPIQANKYNAEYLEEEFYFNQQEIVKINDFKWDILFLGYAKDRLHLLLEICDELTRNGVKCNFILVGVKKDRRIEQDGIVYSDTIPYSSYLNLIQQSRVILELMQNGSASNTLRANEAIAYNRKLLTNQPFIKAKKSYDSRYISSFSSLEDIDINFIKEDIDYSVFDTIKTKDPVDRLLLIDKLIEKYERT